MSTITDNATKTSWALDPAHSELSFKVKHLMITTVTGYFKSFRATMETMEDDLANFSNIIVEVDAASVTTNNEHRDTHLRSEEFFDAEQFKLLQFEATGLNVDGDAGTLQGNLTIKNVTQPVTLQVEVGGVATDPYGQTKAGFTITGKISRKAFGLTWNAMTEAGGTVLGDEVKIHAEIQLIKQ